MFSKQVAKISLIQLSRFDQYLFAACSLCARPRAGLWLFDDIPKVHRVIYLLKVLLT